MKYFAEAKRLVLRKCLLLPVCVFACSNEGVIETTAGADIMWTGDEVNTFDRGSESEVTQTFGVEKFYVSGSRLRAVIGETPDGAKEFLGWHDKELNIRCFFLWKTADGTERCLPSDLLHSVYYEDSACSKPVFIYSQKPWCSYQPPRWGSVLDGCGRVAHVYRLGNNTVRPSKLWEKKGTSCVESSVPTDSEYLELMFYRASEEVPLSTFQSRKTYVE